MPELTDNLDRVVPMGVLDPDSTFFDLDLVIKALIMLSDVLLREDHHLSNIGIIDMKNYTLGHVTKTTVPQLKKYCVVLFNTYKIRARAIHFINTPPYAGYVLELIKSVIGSKLAARIQIHGTDLSGLHKHIPKRLLPTEHGGDAGPIARYHEAWIKKMATYNDWYKEQENVKSDETKRQGRSRTCGDLFGIEGSFRKLNVD
ncbi:retinaldehyde-binding protein 1-like [Periplaneta americana]|uniref:retinaldehyde-binding protein 1-like n=1 Tax=Periplaneta americana TaxID=6978 RepID=UPI0037E99E8A